MKTIEILKDDEIIRTMEIKESDSADLFKRAKLDSEVMNRDNTESFKARFKPEVVEIPIEEIIPDEPA